MPTGFYCWYCWKWYGWYRGRDTVRQMDMISSLCSGIYQCYERRFGFECGPDQLRMDVPAPGIDPSSPELTLTYIIVFVVPRFCRVCCACH